MTNALKRRQIELLAHIAGQQITPNKSPRGPRLRDVHRPHKIVHQHHAHRTAVVVGDPVGVPQHLAVLHRQRRQLLVPGIVNGVLVQHHRRGFFGHRDELLGLLRDWSRLPSFRTAFQIQAHHTLAIVIHHIAVERRKREHRNVRPLMLPQRLARFRIGRHHETRCIVIQHHPVAPIIAEMAPGARLLLDLLHVRRIRIAHCQQDAVRQNDFFRCQRVRIGLQFLTRCRIKLDQRSVDIQRGIHAVAHSNELARHLRGPAFPRPVAREPLLQRLLPKDHAVVGITGHQLPVRWQLHRGTRSFVHDVKDATVRRHHRIQTGHALMRRGPERRARPLKLARQSAGIVLPHRIVRGVILVVRPLLLLRCPGLGFRLPTLRRAPHPRSARGHHPRRFFVSHLRALVQNEQVHQVLRIRQRVAIPKLCRKPCRRRALQESFPRR